MTAFQKLLIPLDDTPQLAVTLPMARTLAGGTGTLTLRHVVPREASHEEFERARERLEPIAHELRGSGARVHVEVRRGDPSTVIVRLAQDEKPDALVMATHNRDGLERLMLGSVTREILAQSPAPVLLVRPGGKAMTHLARILVPVDGTPGSTQALGLALHLARDAGASLDLLHVNEPIPLTVAEAIGNLSSSIFAPLERQAELASRAYVGTLAERTDGHGVTVRPHAASGQAAGTIARLASELQDDLSCPRMRSMGPLGHWWAAWPTR